MTAVETTTGGMIDSETSEIRLHDASDFDVYRNGTDVKVNTTFAPVSTQDSNQTAADEDRIGDVVATTVRGNVSTYDMTDLLARMDESVVTMPYQLDNGTVVAETNENVTDDIEVLAEARMDDENSLALSNGSVTEGFEFVTSTVETNTTYVEAGEFDSSLLRFEDSTDVIEIDNSTTGLNHDSLGNNDQLSVIHAESEDFQNTSSATTARSFIESDMPHHDTIESRLGHDFDLNEKPDNVEPLPVRVPDVHSEVPDADLMTSVASTVTATDATPVLSDLERISEDEDEGSPSVQPPQNGSNSTVSIFATQDIEHVARGDADMHMNASALSDLVASLLDSQNAGHENDTEFGIASRALVGESRDYLRYNEGFCLAVPYPCGPGKTCIIVGYVSCEIGNRR